MICYAFPLAHEAAGILRETKLREDFSIGDLPCTLGQLRGRQVLIARIGMGQEQAQRHAEIIFQHFRLKAFVLAGYGGALVPQLKVGQIVVSNNFTSEEVLPFLRLLTGFDFAGFCTTGEVVGTPELRQNYARTTQHQVAEMETAPVAHLVRAREVPFVALRVISDDFPQVLPVHALAASFDAARGRATPLRLLTRLALHPWEIRPFARFVSGLGLARKSLTTFLFQLNLELPGNW